MPLLDTLKSWIFVSEPVAETKAAVQPAVPMLAPTVNIVPSFGGYQLAPSGYGSHQRGANNLVFQTIVGRIQSTARSIPWNVYKLRRDKNSELADKSPYNALVNSPNPKQSWSDFVSKYIGHMLCHGNVFIYCQRVPGPSLNQGQAKQLWILPASTEVVIGDGVLDVATAYSAELRPGQFTAIPAEDVIHIKRYNPYDENYGLSPVKTAAMQLSSLDAAMRQNLEQLINGGPAVVVYDDTVTGEDDEKGFTSDEEKAHIVRTILGPEKIKYMDYRVKSEQIGITPADLMILEAINASAGMIADLLGYPAVLLSGTDGDTFANVDAATKALYNNCVLPLLHELRDALDNKLSASYKEALYLDLDLSGIDVLKRDQTALLMALESASYYTINEMRVGAGLPTRPDGDVFHLPNTKRIVADLKPTPEPVPVVPGDAVETANTDEKASAKTA